MTRADKKEHLEQAKAYLAWWMDLPGSVTELDEYVAWLSEYVQIDVQLEKVAA